mgnify:CR=1 FL=1
MKTKGESALKKLFQLFLCAFLSFAGLSNAAYPDQPVKIIIPYPPGGASDAIGRILADKLKDVMGGTFVVENRPGANGNIAGGFVAKAPPDGYTLLMANVGPSAINQSIYPNLSYDVNKSFAPITQVSNLPIVLVAGPKVTTKDIRALVTDAKANPGKYTFASAGNGSSNHLAGEKFRSDLNLDMTHIPYKGDGPALTDVMGGQVSMMFVTAVSATPFIQGNKVTLLAVASKKRLKAYPNVPTITESVDPGFEAYSWGGLVAPAGTPKDVINKLNAATHKVLEMPDVKEKINAIGAEIVMGSPEEFAAYIKSETDKWGKIAKSANVIAE